MSEASMLFHPAIEEPSKKCPLSNLSMVNALTGTDTCCSLPRVSVKRKSTNLTSFSLIIRSEEHTSELQSLTNLVCRLLLEKKKNTYKLRIITCRIADPYVLNLAMTPVSSVLCLYLEG